MFFFSLYSSPEEPANHWWPDIIQPLPLFGMPRGDLLAEGIPPRPSHVDEQRGWKEGGVGFLHQQNCPVRSATVGGWRTAGRRCHFQADQKDAVQFPATSLSGINRFRWNIRPGIRIFQKTMSHLRLHTQAFCLATQGFRIIGLWANSSRFFFCPKSSYFLQKSLSFCLKRIEASWF